MTTASLHRSGRIESGSVDAQHGDALTFRNDYLFPGTLMSERDLDDPAEAAICAICGRGGTKAL